MKTDVNLATEVVLGFVAFWPIVTAAVWIGGGLIYRLLEERTTAVEPPDGWPGVSVLVPCYNEAAVIGRAVEALRAVDYPELEVLVLDDGSTDATAERGRQAAADDPRVRVVRDPVNRGKADRLNLGLQTAGHELVLVLDADAHLQEDAIKRLVMRITRSPRIAAVAGMPHVTNRGSLLSGLQMLEYASIVGLIRRTQALLGRVGTVAGIIGLFRRSAVLEVGGYDPAMATEDIDLTWRLLLAGWETDFEPNALVGMQVPGSLRGLWAQRRRWARGQGEVLRGHLGSVRRWSHRAMWPVAAEGLGSLLWVLGATLAGVFAIVDSSIGEQPASLSVALAWGIAIAVVATLQLTVALALQARYDRACVITLLLGPVYPLAYWALSAAAALRSEVVALIWGAGNERVVWNIPREDASVGGGAGA